jgi:hypothetical protein
MKKNLSFCKNNFLSIVTICLVFTACNTSQPQTENKTYENDFTKKTEIVFDTSLQKVIDLFKSSSSLPFVADTVLMNKEKMHDSLGTAEILILNAHWFKHDLISSAEYDLKYFYKIDSLKASKKYSEWIQHLDIGMTKYSNAYALTKLQLDEHTLILIWALCNSSYEACPYSVSTTIYFTIIYNGKTSQSFMLGETGSYSDPPVAMELTTTGILNNDGKFSLKLNRMNEDMDEPTQEITNEKYEFSIVNGKINLVREKKDPPLKVKRKKEKEQ